MGLSFLLLLLLLSIVNGQENCSTQEALERLKAIVKDNYLWADKLKDYNWKDYEDFIKSLRSVGDRWSAITRMNEDKLWYSSSKVLGVGIRWDDQGYIVRVFKDSPAERAGLREGDLIVFINGVADKNLWRKAISEVPQGQIISIDIIRDGIPLEIKVVKGEFVVPPIEEARVFELFGRRVGYVRINNFTQPTYEGFSSVLEDFKKSNIDLLVIDLRYNGGGLIGVAKSMLDLLVGGEGVMFYLEGRGKNHGVYTFKNKEGFKKPIVVLVSKQTASSAELFASVLKRYAGALVVGEGTVGKYVGSNMYKLDDCGNMLRLITFEMKLPDGSLVFGEKGVHIDCKGGEKPVEDALRCLREKNLLLAPAESP